MSQLYTNYTTNSVASRACRARVERVERVELVMSSVSSRAVRQPRHSQNTWARHVERIESCRVDTWRAKLIVYQYGGFYSCLERITMVVSGVRGAVAECDLQWCGERQRQPGSAHPDHVPRHCALLTIIAIHSRQVWNHHSDTLPFKLCPLLLSCSVCVTCAACGGDLMAEQGQFTSPRYPDPYTAGVECVWNISISPGNRLAVSFRYATSRSYHIKNWILRRRKCAKHNKGA